VTAVFAPPTIDQIGGVYVVRDDLVRGGTKARVIGQFLHGASEWVYASPAYGYAQVALAHTAVSMGKRATVFVAKRKELHPRTAEAKAAGAKIVQVPHGYLSNVQAKARAYAEFVGAGQLPFGFDFPEFLEALCELACGLPIRPSEVWTVAGSGTLNRALQMAWPQATFHAVRVGALPNVAKAELHTAPEKFEQDARQPPPFPSYSNYDAKAWRFVEAHASEGALFWNVAA